MTTSIESGESGKGIFRSFTAVDLVTLAVFAALYRALWYVWHALGFLFPFNLALNGFFFVLTAVAAIVIVRKVGAGTVYVIATQLINLFLQGELLAAAAIYLTWALLADLFLYFRVRAGADPYSRFSDMVIASVLLSLVWTIVTIGITVPFMFMIELPTSVFISLNVVSFVVGIVGGIIGYGLGDRLQKVLI